MFFANRTDDNKKRFEYIYQSLLEGIFPYKYHTEKSMDCVHELAELTSFLVTGDLPENERIELLSDDEIEGSRIAEEYRRFMTFWKEKCIHELMYIGKYTTPFNTLGHVSGVHRVAMHMARQMRQAGFPVDPALVSAAAAAHDLGKYGCTGEERDRVPYLHYYYTKELLEREGMPVIARIAGNHSVWDLERDSLSAEWMLLIYADFRVKSVRDAAGNETAVISSLEEAFEVIKNKLDNMDDAKAARYERAYSRLKKFEDYMIYLGVDPDLEGCWKKQPYDPELAVKFSMIDYQLRVASGFNYLTQADMENMLEELAKRFADSPDHVRRQIVMIMNEIIGNYDRTNNKELPEGAVIQAAEKTSADLKEKYKEILW